MNTQIKFIIATLITVLGFQVQAESLTIACYNDSGTAQLYFGIDTEQKQFTYAYNGALGEDTCLVHPNSSFSEKMSYITYSNTGGAIDIVAQIINGDPETPIFECNGEITMAQNAMGQWVVQRGEVYHNGVKNDLSEFIGQTCYVQ